jgi:hypothetical protein
MKIWRNFYCGLRGSSLPGRLMCSVCLFSPCTLPRCMTSCLAGKACRDMFTWSAGGTVGSLSRHGRVRDRSSPATKPTTTMASTKHTIPGPPRPRPPPPPPSPPPPPPPWALPTGDEKHAHQQSSYPPTCGSWPSEQTLTRHVGCSTSDAKYEQGLHEQRACWTPCHHPCSKSTPWWALGHKQRARSQLGVSLTWWLPITHILHDKVNSLSVCSHHSVTTVKFKLDRETRT